MVAAGLIALAATPAAAEAGGRTSIDLRATYDARATIDWDEGTIVVRSMARITNTSGRAIDYLVLNSFAAALGRMEILRAEVDGARVAITVEDQNLLVPLAARLAHGAATEVLIKYRAHFRSGSAGRDYHFSRANGIISCLRWIPWVSDYTPFWESDWGEQMNTAVSPLVQVSDHHGHPADHLIDRFSAQQRCPAPGLPGARCSRLQLSPPRPTSRRSPVIASMATRG